MSTARDVLQKLLRSPKPRKKSDLLNQREYNLLATTSFEQFLAENFNEDQIGKLCAAEVEQLHFHYTELEKKSARIMKKVRDKATSGSSPRTTPRVVVRNVPAASLSATSVVRAVPPVPMEVPEAGVDLVLDNIENAIEESRGRDVPEQRQVEELNVSLERIDLSRSMAPSELLLEEPIPVPLPEQTELDLGPPGDAGAFFGSTDPMPMDDPQVREQVLGEFPSLRRPQNDRQYEDLDEDLNARLMPPPPAVPVISGISSSTPITTDPQLRRRVLGAIDLSSIKYPTPAAFNALLRSDESSSQTPEVETVPLPTVETAAPDISSIPLSDVSSEKQPSSNVDSGLPNEPSEPEPMQIEPVPEPVPDIQPPPSLPQEQPPVPPAVPSSSSSSSSDRPARTRGAGSRNRCVPEYNPSNLVVKFQTRTTFPLNDVDDDDASMFDAAWQLSERFRQLRAARIAATQRQVPQVAEDQQASLRDISSTGAAYADISSIRELPSASGAAQLQLSTSGALYPIPERPQVEEREELTLRKSAPQRTPLGDPLELSAKRAELAVEPVIDVPNLEVPPQIVITATAEETREQIATAAAATATNAPTIAENPVVEMTLNLTVPEVPVPVGGTERPEGRPQQDPVPIAGSVKNDEKFAELLKLYLNINHAAKTARHGTVSMEHLQVLECAPRSKLNCCRLFAKLLELKRHGLIETGVDERGRIRAVTVKG